MSLLHGLALVLLPVLASTATAQPLDASAPRALGARTVVLTGATVPVRVAPKVATLLLFDADLDLDRTELEAPQRFTVHAWSARTLALEPLAELASPVVLTVHFRGADPDRPQKLSLVTPPAGVDAQVRLVRSASATEARVAELEARHAACEARLAEAVAGAGVPSEVAFVRAGRIAERGVDVIRGRNMAANSGRGTQMQGLVSYVADEWVVVTVPLDGVSVPAGWKPARAWLASDASGERFSAHTVLLEPAGSQPEGLDRLVVGAVRPPGRAGLLFRLEVIEEGGQAPLSISGIMMKKWEAD